MVRYVCIGGRILDGSRSGSYVSGISLVSHYRLGVKSSYIVAESDEDPRLHGIRLDELTVLRPLTNGKYGFPSVDAPLTGSVTGLLKRLVGGNFKDLEILPILADALEDGDYNDPMFPWLLKDLRHPELCTKIDVRIWKLSMVKIKIGSLLTYTKSNSEVLAKWKA